MIIKIFLVSFVLSFAHCNEIRLSSTDEKLPPHEEDRIFNGQKQKQSGMQYQILRGHYLTTFRAKRSADNDDEVRPPVMALSVPVEGRDVNLVLEQTDIAHPNIVIQLDSDNSGNVNLKPWLNCFYSGGHGDVWAVVSTCDGLNAIIHNRKKSYQLEEISTEVERGRRPKRDSPGSRFVIFPLEVQRGGFEKRGGGIDIPVSLEEPEEHHLPKLTVGNELSRSKRSVIKGPYTVELAVFVDHALYKYIKKRFPNSKDPKKKTVEIVMTLINAVHRMYSHSSLGNSQVSMVVKTVRKLNEGTPNHAKGDIYAYLTNFSKWQKKNNPSSSKKQWDHALLLTGVDLWSENKADNSTVGLAYVGGMCSKGFSCTINEASTLAAAYIIAHELGHNFNMKHDGIATAKSCPGDKYIMASVMASGATEWSSCSKKAISSFLKDKGYCLTPEKTTVSKEGKASHRGLPPGKRFDANEQCSYMYGLKWKHFKDNQKPFDNVCKEIWCRNSRILRTPSAPALEGTPCGKGKVCKGSVCTKQAKMDGKEVKNNEKEKKVKTDKKEKKVVIKKKDKHKKVTEAKKDKEKENKRPKSSQTKEDKKGIAKKGKKKKNENEKLTKTDGDSTGIKVKTKFRPNSKNKKKRKPKKVRRIDTPTHIVIKKRDKYVKGKGWRLKVIRIRKSQKMLGIVSDRTKKKKRRKRRKKKKKKGTKTLSPIMPNPQTPIIKTNSPPIVTPPQDNCQPVKVKRVDGKGWWVKVPLKCVKHITG